MQTLSQILYLCSNTTCNIHAACCLSKTWHGRIWPGTLRKARRSCLGSNAGLLNLGYLLCCTRRDPLPQKSFLSIKCLSSDSARNKRLEAGSATAWHRGKDENHCVLCTQCTAKGPAALKTTCHVFTRQWSKTDDAASGRLTLPEGRYRPCKACGAECAAVTASFSYA